MSMSLADQLDALRADPAALIRYLRTAVLTLSQEELARQLDVGLRSIVRWERGDVHPNPRNWRKVLALVEQAIEIDRARRARRA